MTGLDLLYDLPVFSIIIIIIIIIKRYNRPKNKNQLDVTYYFIVLLTGSTCFGHYYAHRQELATMMLITKLVVSFLVCCRLEVRCGSAGVVSGQQAKARHIGC